MDLEKSFLKTFLGKFKGVSFNVEFWDGDEVKVGEDNPKFKIILHKPLKKKDILTSTTLAFGEAYMKGDIEIEGDLFTVFDELLKCIDEFSTNFGALTKIFGGSTSMKKQKEEVTSHYDIGNNFYKIWLDDTLSYSCAYFKKCDDTLHDAQMNKIHHILKKLNLSEGLSLLDIGCGWGGLLIEAAKLYKVKGLGITLSEEQYKAFKERIERENLQDYIDVKIMDYRELSKSHLKFDRVVSVGMLEHVGRPNYDLFFKNVDSVLKKGGLFLLHYISGLQESEGDAWIKKYIFPGGVLPSFREIINVNNFTELEAAVAVDNSIINIKSDIKLDEELIIKAAKETGVIVTAEEHSVIGGLGSAVAEVVSENCPVPVLRVGVKDTFGESGKPNELLEKYGLTSNDIVNKVKEVIKLK